jgi:putative endonuclease
MKKWYCYIVRCSDASFYTGATNDIVKRIEAHNKGTASKYTRCRRPVFLIYREECKDKSSALKRETQIKKLSKGNKQKLVEMQELIFEEYIQSSVTGILK